MVVFWELLFRCICFSHTFATGTETFPTENEYDSFLSRHGGSNNAYTEMEHTLFHFAIPQDSSSGTKTVWRAMEMFADFFKRPLLKGNAAERELGAVQSEFELNRKDDDCRLSQVMCHTCGMDGTLDPMGGDADFCPPRTEGGSDEAAARPSHPFAKFSWGNEKSLKIDPESRGVDVLKELRDHYDRHYYARNMRLVVMAGYELDEIESRVREHFRDVPAEPRLPNKDGVSGLESGSDGGDDKCTTNLEGYGLPFHSSSLGRVFRIVPVRDHHTLTLTWQFPSLRAHWRTKPADLLGHLIGHEASGSVLSVLKSKKYAMGLSAGVGDEGLSDASTHALFEVDVSLSKLGIRNWEEVVKVVFE